MTRQERILAARDQLQGIIADAHVAARRGPELAIRLRADFERVEQILRDLLTEPKPAEADPKANGQAAKTPVRK